MDFLSKSMDFLSQSMEFLWKINGFNGFPFKVTGASFAKQRIFIRNHMDINRGYMHLERESIQLERKSIKQWKEIYLIREGNPYTISVIPFKINSNLLKLKRNPLDFVKESHWFWRQSIKDCQEEHEIWNWNPLIFIGNSLM